MYVRRISKYVIKSKGLCLHIGSHTLDMLNIYVQDIANMK